MDNQPHLQALATKHADLDEQLRLERSRPAPDDATITLLKRRKLLIKEQIAQR